jgi:uncharacterized membrane protein
MFEPNWLAILRWVHILAGAAWLGEVVVIVFVLVPAVLRLPAARRPEFIAGVFPRIFRLASVLAFLTLAAGAGLNYQLTGWQNLGAYFASPRGVFIAIGGGLGLALGIFHFTAERRLESGVSRLASGRGEADRILKVLAIVPRVGLGVLLVIFLSMMLAARGY